MWAKVTLRLIVLFLLCVSYSADHFKEICPAGHGYTYSLSDVQIAVTRLGEDDLQSTGVSWEEESPTFSLPQVPLYPENPETPQAPRDPETPQHPLHPSHPDRETPKEREGEDTMFGTFNLCQADYGQTNGRTIKVAAEYTSYALRPPNVVLTFTHDINNAGQLSDFLFSTGCKRIRFFFWENSNINRMFWSEPPLSIGAMHTTNPHGPYI